MRFNRLYYPIIFVSFSFYFPPNRQYNHLQPTANVNTGPEFHFFGNTQMYSLRQQRVVPYPRSDLMALQMVLTFSSRSPGTNGVHTQVF